MSVWLVWLAGWALLSLVMAVLWHVQRRTRRADWVDFAWSLGTGGLAALCALAADGNPLRGGLIAALAGIWGARLAWHLAARIRRSPEDSRYARLRRDLGGSADAWLFWFFQAQAFLCAALSVPALLAARNPDPIGWTDAAGILVWLVSMAGEAHADRQLSRFQRNTADPRAVCRVGLWAYSRHPNYFFEWIHWWSYVCIGWAAPLGWLTLMGPAAMYLLIRYVTGIPPNEAAALAKRGDAYRDYQRAVSPFFPWPPREAGR